METSLNCEPPSRPSNWHSSVDSIIISSDSSVEKITKGSFTSQQVEGENVLGLEMETDRGENNDDIETSLTDILHPPPLHDSRPSGMFEKCHLQPLSMRKKLICNLWVLQNRIKKTVLIFFNLKLVQPFQFTFGTEKICQSYEKIVRKYSQVMKKLC